MNKIQKVLLAIARACGSPAKPSAKVRILETGESVDVYGKPANDWREGSQVFIYSSSSPTRWTARNIKMKKDEDTEILLDTHRFNHPKRLQRVIAKKAIVIQKF